MIGYFGSVESNGLYLQFQGSMNIMDLKYQQNYVQTYVPLNGSNPNAIF